MHCREATGDGAKENYRDRGSEKCGERARILKRGARDRKKDVIVGRDRVRQRELSRFDNSQNVKRRALPNSTLMTSTFSEFRKRGKRRFSDTGKRKY